MSSKDMIYETKHEEGYERPAVLVVVPSAAGNITYLCHKWGLLDGRKFFDPINDTHVEIHGDIPFIIHVPSAGYTMNSDGTCRPLVAVEQHVVLQ